LKPIVLWFMTMEIL